MSNIVKTWGSQAIRFQQRGDRYWVSLTDMAQASGKSVGHWKENAKTAEFLQELESIVGFPIMDSKVGGTPETTGTWAIEEVAIEFASWCSVQFKIWINCQIKELMTTGKVELRPSEKSDRLRDLELQIELEKQRNRGWELQIDLVTCGKAIAKEVKETGEKKSKNLEVAEAKILSFLERRGGEATLNEIRVNAFNSTTRPTKIEAKALLGEMTKKNLVRVEGRKFSLVSAWIPKIVSSNT